MVVPAYYFHSAALRHSGHKSRSPAWCSQSKIQCLVVGGLLFRFLGRFAWPASNGTGNLGGSVSAPHPAARAMGPGSVRALGLPLACCAIVICPIVWHDVCTLLRAWLMVTKHNFLGTLILLWCRKIRLVYIWEMSVVTLVALVGRGDQPN